MTQNFIIWLSGIPVGFLIYHYLLGRPMARLLGFEEKNENSSD